MNHLQPTRLCKTIGMMATSILLLFFSLPVHAQWQVGINAGYDHNIMSTQTNYAYDMRYKGVDGFVAGVSAGYNFFDWLGVRTELQYVRKGQDMHRNRTNLHKNIYENVTNQYLHLPIMAHFSFGGERLRGFMHAGGYMGAWLASHRKGITFRFIHGEAIDGTTMLEQHYDEAVKFSSARDNRFEAGIVGGTGLTYRVAPRVEVELEARCYYALTDMQRKYMMGLVPRYNTTFVVQASCHFLFGKNHK